MSSAAQSQNDTVPVTQERRTRSLRGCVTCRRRRTKCDEGRPKCRMCQTSGILCGGYLKNLFFDFEDHRNKNDESRFRRPLLTVEQRERMSCQITSNVAPDRIMWHIAKIDEFCEESPDSQSIQTFTGPFGAFRVGLGSPHLSSKGRDIPDPMQAGMTDNDTLLEQIEGDNEPLIYSESALQMLEGHGDLMEDWCSLPSESLWSSLEPASCEDWWNNTSAHMDCLHGLVSNLPSAGSDPNYLGLELPTQRPLSPKVTVASTAAIPHSHTADGSIPASVQVDTLHDAVFLLKHYSTTVLQGLTPYRHSKTPWHILFIPHAKTCLAAITMGELLSHASLCAFFGILSSSAYSLAYTTGSKKWHDQGQAHSERARNYARLMLRTAYDVPKVEKYKVILMALLTMIQISNVSRNREQAEYYFLETEKFIRVKGLGRRMKSRKVRLLHHCYVFERLLYESAFSGSFDSPHRRTVRQAIESSGAGSFSYDGLSFGSLDLQNLDQQVLRVKGQEEGENDLHVKYPGVWAETQYPEIFGIPEIYMFLLSAVIRLGRSKIEAAAGSLATSLSEYMKCAKELERFILRLKYKPSESVVAVADPEQQDCQSLLETLSTTMQQALTIHFYRTVYDVDSSMLQPQVKAVSECLRRCEAICCGAGYGSARLIWPAYIAAAEATDPDTRGEFTSWFQSCAKRSGLMAFADTKEAVEKVWANREMGRCF